MKKPKKLPKGQKRLHYWLNLAKTKQNKQVDKPKLDLFNSNVDLEFFTDIVATKIANKTYTYLCQMLSGAKVMQFDIKMSKRIIQAPIIPTNKVNLQTHKELLNELKTKSELFKKRKILVGD